MKRRVDHRQTIWMISMGFTVFMLLLTNAENTRAQWSTSGGGDAYNTNSSGKVGIGTQNPNTLLELNSATPILTFNASTINSLVGLKWNGTGYGTTTLASSVFNGNSGEFRHEAGYSGYGGFHSFFTNGSERLRIDSNGKVGIGTTSPTTMLTITDGANPYPQGTTDLFQLKRNASNGSADGGVSVLFGNNSNGFRIKYGGTSDRLGFLDGGNVEGLSILNGGNVGIGTTSPPAQLGINQDTDVQATLRLSNNGISGRQINIKSAASGLSGSIVQSNTGADFEIGNLSGALSFMTNNANRLYVKNDGKVGINNNSPTVALDVIGDIKASGVIHAKYQDVAEWVPSSEQLAAGTVVVLDSTKSNQVISSSQSYDTRVAGVISAQPGIALGEKGDSKVLVATTGRVKVKVDASKGAIHIGDLLVTSDVPGVAMRSEPVEFAGRKMHMPGTLIGKALEPLEKGIGEILVLLSLQ